MKIVDIDMPKGCRYMSDYDELINSILPINGKAEFNLQMQQNSD